MEFHDFLKFLVRKRKTVYGIIAIFVLVGVVSVAVQRFKYSAKSQLLVVQEYSGPVDAYTASKSTEHLSNVLASVITSNSFFTKVITNSPSIDTQYFGASPRDQMREWSKTVNAKSINDTGIIAITVYHPNRNEAQKIAGAVNYVLMTQHSAYDGAAQAVKVRLIDQPISSTIPVKPNIPLVLGTMVILGFLSSLVYIYLSSENASLQMLEYQKNSQPAFIAQTMFQNQAINRAHAQPSPYSQEEYIPQSRPHFTPYGQHARVSLEDNFEPLLNEEAMADPEIIVRQGNMRNIID